MPEINVPVTFTGKRWFCGECGEEVTFDGSVLTSYPPQYPHTCPNGHRTNLGERYPRVDTVIAPAPHVDYPRIDIREDYLDLPMGENDAYAATIRDYLIALLRSLWDQQEGFSGKRPFGNSGWEYDVYKPLVRAGVIKGAIDSDGYLETVDTKRGREVVHALIDALGRRR